MPVPAVMTGGSARVQFRIANRRTGQQMRTQGDRLASGLGKLDQRPSPCFAAGARGRRNGHQGRKVGRDPIESTLRVIIIGKTAGVGDKKANCLGGVDRAPSSQTDQTVTTIRVVLLKAFQDIGFRRVALDALEKDSGLDRGRDLGSQTRSRQPGVGHDQRPRDPQSVQLGRQ